MLLLVAHHLKKYGENDERESKCAFKVGYLYLIRLAIAKILFGHTARVLRAE
jgi:hypothetical protein